MKVLRNINLFQIKKKDKLLQTGKERQKEDAAEKKERLRKENVRKKKKMTIERGNETLWLSL